MARSLGLFLGPLFALLLYIAPLPDSLSHDARLVACLGVLMATWWATEAVPLAVTSLLPIVFLPATGILNLAQTGAPYFDPIVILLVGGFIVALSVEKWNLHERIALNIVYRAGDRPKTMILGFMVAAALLSAWISNTATTLMLLPVAMSVARAELGRDARNTPFALCLLLGVAYAASVGGVATPVGTPTNLIAIRNLTDIGTEVSFVEWMQIGVPIAILMIPLMWLALTRLIYPIRRSTARAAHESVGEALSALGRITGPEVRVALLFGTVATLWVTRQLWEGLIPTIDALRGLEVDAIIAVAGAIALFLLPSGKGEPLMDWETTEKRLPWGVVLLFGGGLALAAAMRATGLATWIGEQAAALGTLPLLIVVLALVSAIIFLTELTSNVATVTAFAPVIVTIATSSGLDPAAMLVPAAIAGSFAFMLPVATAPNAIVFASGQVGMDRMIRAGLVLNFIGIAVVVGLGIWLAPLVL